MNTAKENIMWNYSFVLPSFWVMLIILIYYFSKPRLSIRLNRTFLGIITIELLVLAFDYVSSMADERYQFVPVPLLFVHCENILVFQIYL